MNNVTKIAAETTPKLLADQKKNKRLVILALEDYFDESQSAYRNGKSDQAIADELSLSVAFVRQVREEFYGQIAEPGEIGEMRAELAAVRKLADDLNAKLSGLCARNGWKV